MNGEDESGEFYLPPLPLLPDEEPTGADPDGTIDTGVEGLEPVRAWSEIRKEFYDLNDTEQMDASIADTNRRVGWPIYLCMTRRCTCPVHAKVR